MIFFFVKSNFYKSEFFFQKINFKNTFSIKILLFLYKFEDNQGPNKATATDLSFFMSMKQRCGKTKKRKKKAAPNKKYVLLVLLNNLQKTVLP